MRWPRRAALCSALLLGNLAISFCVCARDAFWIARQGRTLLPRREAEFWHRLEAAAAWPLVESPVAPISLRQAVATCRHCTGIEASYGFFAPSVGKTYQLIFRFDYPDGRSKSEQPRLASRAGILRFDSLLSQMGRAPIPQYREGLLRKVAAAAWSSHPEATKMDAALTLLEVLRLADYSTGRRAQHRVLYEYEVTREAVSYK